ncbi:MAG: GtrA family protein [Chloroflexi bacterium]|nr:GtrA family protein [Chloroflexota bacterium]MCY4246838.1 GtrA family protein [Chloroflexota bacterium]
MSGTLTADAKKAARRHHSVSTPIDRLIMLVAQRLGGSKAKEMDRFIKFAFVGLLGFVIDSGTVIILQNSLLPPVTAANEPLDANVAVATTVAFVLAVCSNFVWNRLWTYPDSRSRSARKQLTQFFIVSVIGWFLRTLWIDFAYQALGEAATTLIQMLNADYAPALLDQNKLGTMVALFFGVIAVTAWNFLANRYWTYSDVD